MGNIDLAWAISIHKSQGLTVGPAENVKKLIVDFGKNEGWAPGLMYVVVSRVVHRDCLALDPIQVDEVHQVKHLPFYEYRRYFNLNASQTSAKIFNHLKILLARARS